RTNEEARSRPLRASFFCRYGLVQVARLLAVKLPVQRSNAELTASTGVDESIERRNAARSLASWLVGAKFGLPDSQWVWNALSVNSCVSVCAAPLWRYGAVA